MKLILRQCGHLVYSSFPQASGDSATCGANFSNFTLQHTARVLETHHDGNDVCDLACHLKHNHRH